MGKPKLADEAIELIKAAPVDETHEAVAARVGVSVAVVRKYRREARQDRQEIAREVIARHVEVNIPDALADLTELRKLSKEKFAETGDSRDGRLWLDAIKTTLEHVKPDDAALDAAIEYGLAQLADPREGAPLAALTGAGSASARAYH